MAWSTNGEEREGIAVGLALMEVDLSHLLTRLVQSVLGTTRFDMTGYATPAAYWPGSAGCPLLDLGLHKEAGRVPDNDATTP